MNSQWRRYRLHSPRSIIQRVDLAKIPTKGDCARCVHNTCATRGTKAVDLLLLLLHSNKNTMAELLTFNLIGAEMRFRFVSPAKFAIAI